MVFSWCCALPGTRVGCLPPRPSWALALARALLAPIAPSAKHSTAVLVRSSSAVLTRPASTPASKAGARLPPPQRPFRDVRSAHAPLQVMRLRGRVEAGLATFAIGSHRRGRVGEGASWGFGHRVGRGKLGAETWLGRRSVVEVALCSIERPHNFKVLGVAAIPGKDRAVYFTNTSVVTWSTVSGQRLRKLAGRAAIQRIAVSPVGNVMAACGDDHGSGEGSPSWRLSVWDSFRLFRVDIFSASSVNAIGGAPCSVAVGVDRRAFRA